MGVLVSAAAGAQGIQVQPAEMPAGLVRVPMTVEGRVLARGVPPQAADLVYQWPGTYFEAAFRGTEIYFSTGAGRQGVRLTIDGQTSPLVVSSQPGSYRVGGLDVGLHVVRLQVVTESQAGPDTFGGFAVRQGNALSAMAGRVRQMEFIGDSYTVGYGNTSATRKCSQDEIWSTTDTSQAFGPLLARSYGADYQVNAISGRGVVRNYNGIAGYPVPDVYPYALLDKKALYRDADWHPQVVVIGLGTNDFTTPLHAGEPWKVRDELHAAYEARLVGFLQQLRQRDPQALFILWATDGAQGEIQAEVRRVADRMKAAGEKNLEFLPVDGLAMTGCDAHPSTADDEVIAGKLRELIDLHTSLWQTLPGADRR